MVLVVPELTKVINNPIRNKIQIGFIFMHDKFDTLSDKELHERRQEIYKQLSLAAGVYGQTAPVIDNLYAYLDMIEFEINAREQDKMIEEAKKEKQSVDIDWSVSLKIKSESKSIMGRDPKARPKNIKKRILPDVAGLVRTNAPSKDDV